MKDYINNAREDSEFKAKEKEQQMNYKKNRVLHKTFSILDNRVILFLKRIYDIHEMLLYDTHFYLLNNICPFLNIPCRVSQIRYDLVHFHGKFVLA